MESSPNSQAESLDHRRARSSTPFSVDGTGVERELWYAVASSRLGKPVERRKTWFQLLNCVVRRASEDGAALMVVEGTAAAEWIERAAKLYACPTVLVRTEVESAKDQLLFELSDRLFVLRARRGGKIVQLVRQQLGLQKSQSADAAKTLVAIWPDRDDAGADLVSEGAVGWWLLSDGKDGEQPNCSRDLSADNSITPRPLGNKGSSAEGNTLPTVAGGWLIHCTRGRSGPLPGQTESQWRDEVLLSGGGGIDLGPLEILCRILQQQCLRGSPLGKGLPPVVCFSDLSLPELISRRTYRPHRKRWDYEPFGIAVRKQKLGSLGAHPVTYADGLDQAKLEADDRWRYQATGKTYDWTEEREWRLRGSLDLSQFSAEDLIVFVQTELAASQIAEISRWPVITTPVNV